jgi:integrase
VSTLTADGSSDNTGTSAVVHRPTAHATEATWRACLVSPLAASASATVASLCACRSHGDTKTEKSRRTLALPETAVNALWAHQKRQADEGAASGMTWSDRDLVFPTRTGAALDAANVRRKFRTVCKAAKIGEHWTPRELRHSFVSLMSSSGVPVEEIARLAGQPSSRTTEVVYRRELRPVLTTGAEAMDRIFKAQASRDRSLAS